MDVEGAVELPDTKGISQGVYEELGVDLFFSLWFVFLNNKERERVVQDYSFQIK